MLRLGRAVCSRSCYAHRTQLTRPFPCGRNIGYFAQRSTGCIPGARRRLSGDARLDASAETDDGKTTPVGGSEDMPYTVHDVVEWMNEERANAITVLDVEHVMGGAVGSYLVFATANTKAHMRRIAKAVVYELKERGIVVFGSTPIVEGANSDDWMLVDGGDVVVNVFTHFTRAQYDLDTHWASLGGRPVELQLRPHARKANDGQVDPQAAWSQSAALRGVAAGTLGSAASDALYAESGDDIFSEPGSNANSEGFPQASGQGVQRPSGGGESGNGSVGQGDEEDAQDDEDGEGDEYLYEYEYYDEDAYKYSEDYYDDGYEFDEYGETIYEEVDDSRKGSRDPRKLPPRKA